MRKPTLKTVYLLFLLIGYQAYGQESLSLNKAWNIALKNNYTLMQQSKLVEKAREEISILQTDYYPALSGSGMFARANFDEVPTKGPSTSSEMGIDLFSLTVNQPVFSGFMTKNMVAAANEKMRVEQIQKDMMRRQVLLEIGNLFYNLQENRLQDKVLSSSIHRLEDQLNRVRDLYLSAQATPFDTLDISNRRLMLRNQREILSDAYAIQMARMRYLLNEEAIPEPIEPSTESADFSVDDLDYYIDVALNTRPELKNVTAVKRGQTFYSEALQARFYPQVSASLAFNYLKPTGDLFKNEWTNFYSIFVNFQWELWNWKRDARKVQQVRLDIERLDIQELQMFKDIRHQVEVAWRTCQSTRKMIQLQEALVAQEKEQFRITGQRYNQGLSTMIDLNAAESSLTEAEIELHKHYIDWFRNKLQLAFAIGTLGQDLEEVMNEN